MSSLNDTIALGLVLVLLFGAAALYLYTRVQQCEQKLNLVESILLDIKMGAELREYPDLGLSAPLPPIKPQDEAALYSAALEEAAIDSLSTDDKEEVTEDIKEGPLTNSPKAKAAAAPLVVTKTPAPLSVNYEAMTLVELKELGRQRSIKGFSTMRRSQILEALKTNDGSPSEGVPTKLNEEILTSLLEQASTFESLEAEPASE